MDAQEFDVSFYYGSGHPKHPAYTVIPLYKEDRCILCPADTSLPDRLISTEELDPTFEILFTGYHTNIISSWHQAVFPTEAEPYFKTSSQQSVGKYLLDSRCWTLVPISLALSLVAENPDLTYRYVSPSPPPRYCSIYVSKSYNDSQTLQDFLNACSKYVDERPYLQNLLD